MNNQRYPGAVDEAERTYPETYNGMTVPPRPAAPYPQSEAETLAYERPTAFGGGDDRGRNGGYAAPPAPEQKPGRAGKLTATLLAVALVAGGAGFGGVWAGNQVFGSGSVASSSSSPSNITVNNPGSVNEATAVATEVLPSVVTVDVASSQAAGGGSGVVISADGYVVTNTHVVTLGGETADGTIRVTTSDGDIYDATIVGLDPTYDLAVIKLEGATDLPPITFGDSAALNVGDTTIAVGAPLGLSNTVTTGIVSALNRSIQIASAAAPEGDQPTEDDGQTDDGSSPWYFDLPGQDEQQRQSQQSITISVVQTDAAINPGNSGGALVNSAGQLIGINVAIASATSADGEAGSIGVGFAIPSSIVERVANEIIESGSATHGLLGASVSDAANEQGATVAGAYVAEVVAGGAAEEAGIEAGDVITAVDGSSVGSAADLTALIRAHAADATVALAVVRDGDSITIDATLGTLE